MPEILHTEASSKKIKLHNLLPESCNRKIELFAVLCDSSSGNLITLGREDSHELLISQGFSLVLRLNTVGKNLFPVFRKILQAD